MRAGYPRGGGRRSGISRSPPTWTPAGRPRFETRPMQRAGTRERASKVCSNRSWDITGTRKIIGWPSWPAATISTCATTHPGSCGPGSPPRRVGARVWASFSSARNATKAHRKIGTDRLRREPGVADPAVKAIPRRRGALGGSEHPAPVFPPGRGPEPPAPCRQGKSVRDRLRPRSAGSKWCRAGGGNAPTLPARSRRSRCRRRLRGGAPGRRSPRGAAPLRRSPWGTARP